MAGGTIGRRLAPSGVETMTMLTDIDPVVQEIIFDMYTKKKAAIANPDKNNILRFHDLFDACVIGQLGLNDEMDKDVIVRKYNLLTRM